MKPKQAHTKHSPSLSGLLDPSQTKCQLARSQALEATIHSSAGGHISPSAAIFVPECGAEGHFQPVQCHNQTGYCWCSTHDGRPIGGTSVLLQTPNCTGGSWDTFGSQFKIWKHLGFYCSFVVCRC